MKKKYFQPGIEIFENQCFCLSSSSELGKGESIWDNETPLIPLG